MKKQIPSDFAGPSNEREQLDTPGERRLADAGLFSNIALQSAIFNSANFSSIATDANGVIQIFNVGAERMLGYAAADVTNKITPADMPRDIEKGPQAGFFRYLTKPIIVRELMDTLHMALEFAGKNTS